MIVFCDLRERVTGRFDEIGVYNQCDWYLLPIREQRILSIIIVSMQESDILEAFGNIPFSRQTLERVNF